MVLITAVSLMDGLLQSFIQKIVDIAPHVIVSGERVKSPVPDQLIVSGDGNHVVFVKKVNRERQDVIKNYPRMESLIKSDSRVQVVAPLVSMDVIGMFGTISQPVQLFGIVPSTENEIEKFSNSMVSENSTRSAGLPMVSCLVRLSRRTSRRVWATGCV
jgi:lipoprotein-releasing system permease protein